MIQHGSRTGDAFLAFSTASLPLAERAAIGRISGVSRTLLDELALAGAAEAAERYLLESSAAAAAVQKRLLRQRLVCCVAQAQADHRVCPPTDRVARSPGSS